MRALLAPLVVASVLVTAAPVARAEEPATWSYEEAYRRLVPDKRPHILRAGLETGTLLAAGYIWYWADRERQVSDWDFPSWKQRFNPEYWIYDHNTWAINWIWHAASGAGYHYLARVNGFGPGGAAAIGFAMSFSWELLFEFREKVSINDFVYTTGSGAVFGEFFYWFGRYFNSRPVKDSLVYESLRWTGATGLALHDLIDGRAPIDPNLAPDNLGFLTDIWHRFELSYGFGQTNVAVEEDADDQLHHLRGGAELVALPGFLQRGDVTTWFGQGNLTSLTFDVQLSSDNSAVNLTADTIFCGLYHQRMKRPAHGHATVVGLGMAVEYERENIDPWQDRLALLHLPGLSLENHHVFGRGRLRLAARANPDFAAVHGTLHGRWHAAHPDEREKTVLERETYYYGWGGSLRLSAELVTPLVEVGSNLMLGSYDSHDGRDRMQEELTADVDLKDKVLDGQAWLRFHPTRSTFIEARGRYKKRWAKEGEFSDDQRLRSFELGVGLTF